MTAVMEEVQLPKPEPQKELPKWCKRTDCSLEITKADLSFEEWAGLITQLKTLDKSRQWLLGDGLNDGEQRFHEDYAQVIDPEEEAEKEEEGSETYRQYMQVAIRIPSGSRLPKLSWGHHQTVAYLDPETRDYWLRRAYVERLKREELRKLVRREKVRKERAEGKRASEIEILQTPEAQEWLANVHVALSDLEGAVPKTAPWLRTMIRSMDGVVIAQSERTVEADCRAIMKLFLGEPGSPGVYRATDSEIFKWLINTFYFISDPELDERLEYMVESKMLEIVDREEGRQTGRRGAMDDVYRAHPEYVKRMDSKK